MKKTILFLGTICIMASQSQGQSVVALHSASGVQMFSGVNPFIDAYNASVTGDTVYLPGGFFNVPGTLDKGLLIYGAGHYPDSTTATNKTILTAGFTLGANADSIHMEGLQINGGITFAGSTSVNNVTIKRNHLTAGIDFSGSGVPCTNTLITQNVIDGEIQGSNAQQLLLTNNIIAGKIRNMTGMVIQNNILLANYYSGSPYYNYISMTGMANNTISNNIFLATSDTYAVEGTGNFVNNNVFLMAYNPGANSASSNYNNVLQDTIFINQSGNGFSYAHNYHLQSPSTYIGTDATECGIYGGIFPYKEGAVPYNPHIQQKSISSVTDINGNINVNIKVVAQDK